ncbi:MAG: hypothetical protein ACLFVO_26095 [Chloroflexaceae bacterium]
MLQLALCMVATRYARLSSQPVSIQQIQQELTQNIYYTRASTRTLLLTGYNPCTEKFEPLATLRVVIGARASDQCAPLKAMDLLTSDGGWDNFTFADFNAEMAIELGRFAIMPHLGQAHHQHVWLNALITFKLVEAAYHIGVHRYQKHQLWAIMPRYVVRITEAAGIKTLAAPGITLNSQKQAALFKKLDWYWMRSKPGFYRLFLPE